MIENEKKIFELIEQINQTFLILLLFPVFIPYINEKYKMPDLLNHDHHLISDATENLPTSIHKKNQKKNSNKNLALALKRSCNARPLAHLN